MKTQTIKKEGLKTIHAIACSDWKSKLEGYANRKPFDDVIELSQDEIYEMYQASDDKQKTVLDKFITKPKSISASVNSFDDACKVLKIDPKSVNVKGDTKDGIGFKKLKIIIKALNEGWTPNFKNSKQYKYWNYFNFSDDVFSYYSTCYSNGIMDVPSPLYLKSRELAQHASKIAIKEYEQFYCS